MVKSEKIKSIFHRKWFEIIIIGICFTLWCLMIGGEYYRFALTGLFVGYAWRITCILKNENINKKDFPLIIITFILTFLIFITYYIKTDKTDVDVLATLQFQWIRL